MNPKKTEGRSDNNRGLGVRSSAPTSDVEQPGPLKVQKAKLRKARSKNQAKPRAVRRPAACLGPETDIQRSPHLGTILLVDDDPEDVFMVGMAFEKVGVTNPLLVVQDG